MVQTKCSFFLMVVGLAVGVHAEYTDYDTFADPLGNLKYPTNLIYS